MCVVWYWLNRLETLRKDFKTVSMLAGVCVWVYVDAKTLFKLC